MDKIPKRLLNKALQRGLEVYPVQEDGNDLFNAVSDQLKSVLDEDCSPMSLRERAVDHLGKHPISSSGEALEDYLLDEDWDKFLDRMKSPGERGEDALILGALSEELKCNFVITDVTRGMEERTIRPEFAEIVHGDTKLYTLYLGCFSKEQIYVSLRKDKTTVEEDSATTTDHETQQQLKRLTLTAENVQIGDKSQMVVVGNDSRTFESTRCAQIGSGNTSIIYLKISSAVPVNVLAKFEDIRSKEGKTKVVLKLELPDIKTHKEREELERNLIEELHDGKAEQLKHILDKFQANLKEVTSGCIELSFIVRSVRDAIDFVDDLYHNGCEDMLKTMFQAMLEKGKLKLFEDEEIFIKLSLKDVGIADEGEMQTVARIERAVKDLQDDAVHTLTGIQLEIEVPSNQFVARLKEDLSSGQFIADVMTCVAERKGARKKSRQDYLKPHRPESTGSPRRDCQTDHENLSPTKMDPFCLPNGKQFHVFFSVANTSVDREKVKEAQTKLEDGRSLFQSHVHCCDQVGLSESKFDGLMSQSEFCCIVLSEQYTENDDCLTQSRQILAKHPTNNFCLKLDDCSTPEFLQNVDCINVKTEGWMTRLADRVKLKNIAPPLPQSKTAHVFFYHSEEQKATSFAEKVVRTLETPGYGFKCLYRGRNFTKDKDTGILLKSLMETASMTVAILTEKFAKEDWEPQEGVVLSADLGELEVVMLEGCKVPASMTGKTRVYFDASSKKKRSWWKKLINRILKVNAGTEIQSPEPRNQGSPLSPVGNFRP